ncbi:MAG: hypothetical protein FWE23_07445 [Chitinivibrionia bacterium]|nr:hypothetical protein [Chitinivibrionia bacterium]
MIKFMKIFILTAMLAVNLWAQAIDWNADRITISTEFQLLTFANRVNNGASDFRGQTIVLANDITLREEWTPIGTQGRPFRGTFDGNNNAVRGIYINQPTGTWIGFFGFISGGGGIRNLGIYVNITGHTRVGGLVGEISGTRITEIINCYAVGEVRGIDAVEGDRIFLSDRVGGLVGLNRLLNINGGRIENSRTSVNVTGNATVGGLVGESYGIITNSHATGNVSGTGSSIGGLVGVARALITNSYATGRVSGRGSVGGLVGVVRGVVNTTAVSNSYATGNVSGTGNSIGGLIGVNSGNIENSYAIGNVVGVSSVGGLAGESNANITNSYATGSVNGTGVNIGGLVGTLREGFAITIENSYALGGANRFVGSHPDFTSANSGNRSITQMRQQSTFMNWDFADTWNIIGAINNGYPHLRALADSYCNHTGSWSAWTITAATCTEAEMRTRTRTCSICGALNTDVEEITDALGHLLAWATTTEATCTEAGEEIGTCDRAGCSHSEIKSIAVLGHLWDDWEETTPATCERKGEEERFCTRRNCNHSESNEIAALGHDWSNWSVWDTTSVATCTEEGSRERARICGNCNKPDTEILPIAELGHFWGTWSVWDTITTATCDIAGNRERTRPCLDCTETDSEIREIPQLTELDGCAPSSIRNKQNTDTRYGIFLENAIVSNFARISVITPEQATVNLAIFDNLGNVVFSVNDVRAGWETGSPLRIKPAPTADGAIIWNLQNFNGRLVANGAYLIIAEATTVSGRRYLYSARIGVNR